MRAVGQQYSFTPQCILVPTDTPITFRATSADVVHGFLIERTNVNTMLVPGYVSTIARASTHRANSTCPATNSAASGMRACGPSVQVIDKAAFMKLAADRRRLNCVE